MRTVNVVTYQRGVSGFPFLGVEDRRDGDSGHSGSPPEERRDRFREARIARLHQSALGRLSARPAKLGGRLSR